MDVFSGLKRLSKMYVFRPFAMAEHKPQSAERPKARSGHRIVCDSKNLYSYGGFNPGISDTDPEMQNNSTWIASKPLFKELWKFNLITQRWKQLPQQKNMPNELASNAVILRGNLLIIHGGTGVPFGDSCSNKLYMCNVHDGKMMEVPAKGDFPEPQYGQALIYHGPYLYTVGGTTGTGYTCDIHRFDLRTNVWEAVYICSGQDQNEPEGRYRHEVAFDGKMIYVLGGGTATDVFGFSKIPAFDLKTNRWTILQTYGDTGDKSVPPPRRCHGSVQYKDEKTGVTSVFISGGYNGAYVFSDVWKLDLSLLRWTHLRKCGLPRPVYFHSAAITLEGRMYTFGGIIVKHNEISRTDAVYSVWLTVPKLSEICWEALNYYYPHLRFRSHDELLLVGIPLKFVQRFDEHVA